MYYIAKLKEDRRTRLDKMRSHAFVWDKKYLGGLGLEHDKDGGSGVVGFRDFSLDDSLICGYGGRVTLEGRVVMVLRVEERRRMVVVVVVVAGDVCGDEKGPAVVILYFVTPL